MPTIPYLEHLRADSARFRQAIVAAPDDALVPTCPGWTTLDLLWHLGQVQWFWGQIVSRPVLADAEVDALDHGARPADRAGLLDYFDAASSQLIDSLDRLTPDSPAWSWYPPDQTVGFTFRRQAHEAMIHRLDAELVTGARTPLDPQLAADGVDEALTIMLGGIPPWATFESDALGAIAVQATDTGQVWLVESGRQHGVDPQDDAAEQAGTAPAEPDVTLFVADPETAQIVGQVAGSAADLDCWLWGRPPAAELSRTGQESALRAVQAVVDTGLQ